MVMKWLKWAGCAALCVLLAACDKNTSLMEKVVDGDKAAVGQMIAGGAKVDERNAYGWTALSHAARLGNTELVGLLLDHGADVNAADQSGWTPLIRAAMKGHADTVRVLLSRGAAVNMREKNGWTALHWAASRGYGDVAALLLAAGADYTLMSDEVFSPLMLALKEGQEEVAGLLHKAGARERGRDHEEWLDYRSGPCPVPHRLREGWAGHAGAHRCSCRAREACQELRGDLGAIAGEPAQSSGQGAQGIRRTGLRDKRLSIRRDPAPHGAGRLGRERSKRQGPRPIAHAPASWHTRRRGRRRHLYAAGTRVHPQAAGDAAVIPWNRLRHTGAVTVAFRNHAQVQNQTTSKKTREENEYEPLGHVVHGRVDDSERRAGDRGRRYGARAGRLFRDGQRPPRCRQAGAGIRLGETVVCGREAATRGQAADLLDRQIRSHECAIPRVRAQDELLGAAILGRQRLFIGTGCFVVCRPSFFALFCVCFFLLSG